MIKTIVLLAVALSGSARQDMATLAQAGTLPCPGPATEAALIAVAHAEASNERVVEWMTTCGVAFPVGFDTLERLAKAGVSEPVTSAAISARYFYLLSHPSDETIAWILANTQPGAVARPFSADDKATVIRTTGTPVVAAIRTLLDRYHSATPPMTDPEDRRRARLLDALPPEGLTSRFMVLAVNPQLVGGEVVTIMFVHASHLVLDVHVKDGVVAFLRQKPLSTEVRERLANYYRDMMKDPDYLR